MCYHAVETVIIKPSYSLKSVCRQLNVNLRGTISIPDKLLPILERLDVKVSLCRGCRILNQRLTKLYKEMEVMRMKLDIFLEEVNGKLVKGRRRSELVKGYQKTLDGDKQAMLHSGMVEKLRNEIMLKYRSYSKKSQPRIKIIKKVAKKPTPKTASEPKLTSVLPPPPVKLESHPSPADPHPEGDDNDNDDPQAYEMLSVTPDISSFNAEEMDRPVPSQEDRMASSSGSFIPSSVNQPDYYGVGPNVGGADANSSQLHSIRTGFYPHQNPSPAPASSSMASHVSHKCKFCPLSFDFLREKRRHTLQQHPQQRFSCQYCHKSFYDRSTRTRHIRTGTCPLFQAPPKVDIRTMSMEGMQKIAARKLSSDRIMAKGAYPCQFCTSSFSTKHGLGNHVTIVHRVTSKIRKFACNLCQKSFFTQAHLKQHYLGVHMGGRQSDQYPSDISCEYCHQKFSAESTVRRHIKKGRCKVYNLNSFGGNRVQEGASTSTSVVLAGLQSMSVMMPMTPATTTSQPIAPNSVHPYTCQYCNRIFESESYLATHKRMYCEVLRSASELDTDAAGVDNDGVEEEEAIPVIATNSRSVFMDDFNFYNQNQFLQVGEEGEGQPEIVDLDPLA